MASRLTQEEENYVRMSLLLTGISPRAVRVLFDYEFAPANLDSSLKKEYNKLRDLQKKRKINKQQCSLLFTRFPDVPDSKTFDVTLMITLLKHLANLSPCQGDFDMLPPPKETTPTSDLARIKYYGNMLAHLNKGKIDNSMFIKAWSDITGAVGRLGGQSMKRECDNLKTKILDQNNQKILLDIKRSNDEIRELKQSVESLKSANADMTVEVEKLYDTVPWNIRGEDIHLPWLVDAVDFQHMLSKGEYMSYDNRLSLGGPCRAGKSTLASVLIGEEIPLKWNSTDGLVIFFGRNGIDIAKKKMVPLRKGERGHEVCAKIILGKADVHKKSEQLTRDSLTKSVLVYNSTHILNTEKPNETAEIQSVESVELQKLQLQSDILKAVREGKYEIKIAPSDLIDFGGQKLYDMTHQLFIQHRGTFLLMFDGRFGLYNQLKEYPKGVTAASILKHWVDSVLTYTEYTDDIMPMILFSATHRDQCEGDTTEMQEKFLREIKEMFSKYERNNHIHLNTVYFINGIDKNDQEIERMTDQIVKFAMKQSSWGQRRPMQWVPLELQITNMRMKNMNIITKEDLQNVNILNNDLALETGQLEDFLLVQHSLGKLMYYKTDWLENFIIIHPPALVNILRSFVTDEQFWPANEDLKCILQKMTDTGKITKKDLLKLWKQEQVEEYMPNYKTKEFVIQLLVHLDILILPRLLKENPSTDKMYFVPCMIKTLKPSNFTDFGNEKERTICLEYSFTCPSILSSLAYKVIGATVNVWPLKEDCHRPCLYHKAAVLNVAEDNELRVWLEDNGLKIYMTNHISLLSISPDIAASVQECITRNLESSLVFHYNSFGRSIDSKKLCTLYSIKVGIPCGSNACYISLHDTKHLDSWVCRNGEEHNTRYLRYWIFDRVLKTCKPECEGKTDDELKTEPSNKHLVRLGSNFITESFERYYVQLGMTTGTLQKISDKYAGHSPNGIMSMALIEWKETKLSDGEKPSVRNLNDALVESDVDNHLICQIFRGNTKLLDDTNPNLQKTPTEKALHNLSYQIGNCALELGIELGLEIAEIDQTLLKNQKNLPKLIEDILLKWKEKSNVKTVRNLMMSLQRVEKGGFNCLSKMLNDPDMFEEPSYTKDFSDHYKKARDQRGLALIVNYSRGREGSEEDVRRLEHFFLDVLGYNVKREHNLNKNDLMQTIHSIKTSEMTGKAAKQYHCFVFVIMCHGKEDKLSLYGGDIVKVEDIVENFKFEDFAEKPKYFIIQACRIGRKRSYRQVTDNPDDIGDDKSFTAKWHQDSNILISYATTPGYQAYRKIPHEVNPWIGSWFIHALLDVFEKRYKEKDVIKMLEEVRRDLNNKEDYRDAYGKIQLSEDSSTLCKTFFL